MDLRGAGRAIGSAIHAVGQALATPFKAAYQFAIRKIKEIGENHKASNPASLKGRATAGDLEHNYGEMPGASTAQQLSQKYFPEKAAPPLSPKEFRESQEQHPSLPKLKTQLEAVKNSKGTFDPYLKAMALDNGNFVKEVDGVPEQTGVTCQGVQVPISQNDLENLPTTNDSKAQFLEKVFKNRARSSAKTALNPTQFRLAAKYGKFELNNLNTPTTLKIKLGNTSFEKMSSLKKETVAELTKDRIKATAKQLKADNGTYTAKELLEDMGVNAETYNVLVQDFDYIIQHDRHGNMSLPQALDPDRIK